MYFANLQHAQQNLNVTLCLYRLWVSAVVVTMRLGSIGTAELNGLSAFPTTTVSTLESVGRSRAFSLNVPNERARFEGRSDGAQFVLWKKKTAEGMERERR